MSSDGSHIDLSSTNIRPGKRTTFSEVLEILCKQPIGPVAEF